MLQHLDNRMANSINITITAKDQASQVLAALRGTAEETSRQVAAGNARMTASGSQLAGAVTAGNIAYGAFQQTVGQLGAVFNSTVGAAFNQVKQVEGASFALGAYEKNAGAVRTVLADLVSYARSDMGTLFQREDLFKAASNLRGFGEAAGNIVDRVKVLSKGVALGMTNFDELSQIMGRAAQSGELTADAYDQLAYRGIILDSSFRGATVSADQLYKAMDAAIDDSVLSGRAQTIEGMTIKMQSAFRDLGSTILGVDRDTSKFKLGGLGDTLMKGMTAITQFVSRNREMIANLALAVPAGLAAAGAIYGIIAAIRAFNAASIAAAFSNPLLLALTAIGVLAGVVVYNALGKLQKQTQQTNGASEDLNSTLGNTGPSKQATKAMADLAKKLQDIGEQSAKAERDFRESLAQMIQDHQQKSADLSKQLASENADYQKSYDRNSADYAAAQQEIADSHQKKVDKIAQQLNSELALGKWADQSKVRDLQEQLATENAEYDRQATEKKAQYDQDVADNKLSHDQKLLDLQTQLDAENALLSKHAADVAAVRGVMLLDEIDKLKRGNDEQVAAFGKQRDEAIQSAKETADGIQAQYAAAKDGANQAGSDLGKAIGNGMKQALLDSLKDTAKGIGNWLGKVATFVAKGFDWKKSGQSLTDLWSEASKDPAWQFRASGGPASAGKPYVVGEEGPELFVPNASGTVIPAGRTAQMLGGASGVTVNQTNHFYTQYEPKQAALDVGWQLRRA